jgi:peroxidase
LYSCRAYHLKYARQFRKLATLISLFALLGASCAEGPTDAHLDEILEKARIFVDKNPVVVTPPRNSTRFYKKSIRPEVIEVAQRIAAFDHAVEKVISRFGMDRDDAVKVVEARATARPEFNANILCNARSFSCNAQFPYRTANGACNNLNTPTWGMAIVPMERIVPPRYADGVNAPRRAQSGAELPNPRSISNIVHPDNNVPHASITHITMAFGQFLDHDITSTPDQNNLPCCSNPSMTDCFPIPIPPNDPDYAQFDVRCLEFGRSVRACGSNPREQINQATAFIDGSQIYGSSVAEQNRLRSFSGGLLATEMSVFLPRNASNTNCGDSARGISCFIAGDDRLNENPGLLSLHFIWLREHNRIANGLRGVNPSWNDETLYQEARRIVIAELQDITYSEYLPVILGPSTMQRFNLNPPGSGGTTFYENNINPGIINSFATAAYRFGHSLIQRFFTLAGNGGSLDLTFNFNNPESLYTSGNAERIVNGLAQQPSQNFDNFVAEPVTSHLFQAPGSEFGSDLASINIQRGRDHGLPGYPFFRDVCGLSVPGSFNDLFSMFRDNTVPLFQQVGYQSVNDLDLWPAGLSERVIEGVVGPTFACIIGAQFNRLLYGDRFFYTHTNTVGALTSAQLANIRARNFGGVICNNAPGTTTLRQNVFLLGGTQISCANQPMLNFELWRM